MLTLQVQLLISAQDVENYKVIKSELDRLRTMVEKSELWVDKKSSGKGEEVEAGTATDKKEVSGWLAGTGSGGPEWVGRASLTCVLHPRGPRMRKASSHLLGRRAARTIRSSRA